MRLFHPSLSLMSDPDSSHLRMRKSFLLAFGISLLLHSAVLFIGYSSSDLPLRSGANADNSDIPPQRRMIATLQRQPSPQSTSVQLSPTQKPAESAKAAVAPKKLSAAEGVWANRSWTKAERAEMSKFLDELAAQAKPLTGQALASKSKEMARQIGRSPEEDGVDRESKPAAGKGKVIEPYSLEMYFDAFLRKLNRSAAFVNNERRVRGARKALVEISLNSDGSLKSYRVIHAADQAVEIAYIKSVVDRASPFSAFPPDIRQATDSLSIMMCIYPAREGGWGGFSRSSGDQDCKG